MADFCKQCSDQLQYGDGKDLADLGKPGEELKPGHGYPALCEGCGPTLVDKEGRCIVEDCMVDHSTGRFRDTRS